MRKNRAELPDFTATVNKTVSYWQKKKKNRQIDQENRSENPETSQLTEDQSTYHKGDKNIPRVKKSSISGAVKTGQNHVEQCI